MVYKRKLHVEELHRIGLDEFKRSEKLPVAVVLDNVRSLYNVGSVFRTCDAFRIDKILLCGITAVPPNVEIHKTALGAEDAVDWLYFKDTLEAVDLLKSKGYKLFSAEQTEGSTMLQDFIIDNKTSYAVVFGNEVKGVQQKVIDACEGCIEIPQYGTKHSLNISVAVGIVVWTFLCKIRSLQMDMFA